MDDDTPSVLALARYQDCNANCHENRDQNYERIKGSKVDSWQDNGFVANNQRSECTQNNTGIILSIMYNTGNYISHNILQYQH